MQRYNIRKALNIPEYKIVNISESEEEFHIQLNPYRRKQAICSACGKEHKQNSYHSSSKVKIEDLGIFGKRTYLHVTKRRYRCPEDGCIRTETVPWIKRYSRVTNRFAGQVYRLTSITTNTEVGWYLGLDDEKVYRIDREKLEELAKERLDPIPAAINISVDEVAYLKHHRYLTNVIDIDRRIVIWNAKGRKAEVLDRYYEGIGNDNCRRIESVALDGAKTYISSTKRYAVNALIVYDKFHAASKLNKTVDIVRKMERRKARKENNEELICLTNAKSRFMLLKKTSRLTKKQSNMLERLCTINEPIYQAMLLKDSFMHVYDCANEEEATEHLRAWIEAALESPLEAFRKLAESIMEKAGYILNWFRRKITSAISEGFNNKIKRLKRMAYGYRDIEYFKLKIHQHCGYLNPRRFQLN
jgi:transposase